MTPRLRVQLENELPSAVAVGGGTALFVCGWCFSPERRLQSLDLVLDGERQPALAYGMPRLDPLGALGEANAYRSGFWAVVRIAPRPAGAELSLGIVAGLEGGGEAVAELGRIAVAEPPEPLGADWPAGAAGPRVAICMATHNPPAELLAAQIESIRVQRHRNWVCVISDDCSSPQAHALIERQIEGDPRFVLSRSSRRLGFFGNFERALSLAPADAEYVALADQDDRWHEDKLSTLVDRIGAAQLVYSDARVVTRQGDVVSETWWSARRNNHSSLLSLLVANSVTGAASLFRRELLDYALPFPPAQFAHFHDHWLALVALALGEIEYVDRPLYDYVQHGRASLGHAAANRMTSLRDRVRHQRSPRERVRMWRLHYFLDVCRLLQLAAVLELRCGARMSSARRRELERFVRAEDSLLALARLGLRGARELLGTPETLGAEWMLAHAFLWRRLLAASARDRPQRLLRLDALPPATLVQPPGERGLDEGARVVLEKITPLRFAPSEEAPRRVNLLIPTVDLEHFFGGYIAKFNLARRLVEHGLRVRIVTVDPVGPLAPDWRGRVASYSGLGALLAEIELVFGREAASIECSPGDGFIATTWWTAHVARAALEQVEADRFVYLIQEYEPFTFPMGSYAALAAQSYRFPHFALFSSELLRGYFRAHSLGVYADGEAAGERGSAAFENAIGPVHPPGAEELARRTSRRLLFYARPEPHAARNMFELGVLALARALAEGAFPGDWELHGIGAVERGRRISLGAGAELELWPRSDPSAYGSLLRDHDVGLALMYTPHPSLVPIEMAAAGMLAVTNSFENKTAEALRAISPNLLVAEPTIDSVAADLVEAATRAEDHEARLRGSAVRWSRDWDQSFGEELLASLAEALAPAPVSASA